MGRGAMYGLGSGQERAGESESHLTIGHIHWLGIVGFCEGNGPNNPINIPPVIIYHLFTGLKGVPHKTDAVYTVGDMIG
jgi:hypothetical protein